MKGKYKLTVQSLHLRYDMEFSRNLTILQGDSATGKTTLVDMIQEFLLISRRGGIRLYLPEPFEWLILSSDILNDSEVRNILEDPENYIDSTEYFSWERYFTKLIVEKTEGTWLKYSKTKLNPAYLKGKAFDKIISILPDLFSRN